MLFEVNILSKKRKIIKYRRPLNFNIGVVIFFIIIIYVLFNIFSYLTKTHVAEYQVQQGTIASNYIYQGMIIRDETVEYAGYEGYINYYIKSGSKVSVNDVVYSVDMIGTIHDEISASVSSSDLLSSDTLSDISSELDTFVKDYNPERFSSCYTFFNNLNSEIAQSVNTNALGDLSSKVDSAEHNNTFHKVKSPVAGVISYEIDGFENYTIDDFLVGDLDYDAYKKTHLFQNKKVKASDPVYKRVNSENWNIIVPISEDLAKQLNEKSSIRIRFCKDDFTTNASYSIVKKAGAYYLDLSLKKAMVRYINDRFIDIELVMSEKSGLKIPQSAITSKEFFTIPKEYFTQDEESDDRGLLVRQMIGGKQTEQRLTPTIYYETEDYYYIDNEIVSEGDIVLLTDTLTTYQIGTDKASLIGVYNINKGYAVFKQINIIYENEEYAIVETKTTYGISLYDHIALNAQEVTENQLTTK